MDDDRLKIREKALGLVRTEEVPDDWQERMLKRTAVVCLVAGMLIGAGLMLAIVWLIERGVV